jgi:drug/metabolite transporter (DMT)-like permease
MPLSNALTLLARPAIGVSAGELSVACCGAAHFRQSSWVTQLFGIARQDVASQMLFAGIRFVAAAACCAAGRCTRHGLAAGPCEKRNGAEALAILGLTQTALQYVFFYIGLANATGTKSSIMNATVTFFSVMLAHYLYRNDRLSHRRVLGCLVGFVGVAAANYGPTLLQPDFSWAGEGSIVLAALILAAASIYGKNLSQHINAVVMTGWQMLIGGVVLLARRFARWRADGRRSRLHRPH